MKKLSKFYNKIEGFFFDSSNNTEFLSFFRIAAGIVILLHFISIFNDFDLFFSSKSIIPSDIMATFNQDWQLTFPILVKQIESIGISEATTIIITKTAYILLSVCIIIGFFSRISAFILLFIQILLMKGSTFFIYGADFFTSMSLFYLILFPSDAYFSIRHFFRPNKKKEYNYMPVKRLFQIHISIAYFFSGFDKLLGFNWWNGESIWKAIHLPYANRDFNFDFSWMADHSYILVIIGWSTIIIEMFYPLFVWIPKTRRLWVTLTISMHIGIALVLNLYYFSAIMIVWNLTNFYFENPATVTSKHSIFNFLQRNKKNTLTLT
ncbi:HTTM domain-containing protein [Flavobacterium sediminilitoris]|uniref:HTTM domain-containing protein n=1 Tax=Flavobacterium sediminilitoris TaxID=2024526 RepID=A0ABY4HP77_9FLAO|nr:MULTISPECIES: HTTM domain-containing protein [Flavobacterium]UOX34431.1 HTTM domain-containing protein [Flavobacterium sediminilitoris]